jgi:thiosulfate/3-mercaptopyruvate sulfurtransferase
LWWELRWLGHDRVAVLDGGFAKWLAEGRPTRSGPEARPPASFVAKVRSELVVDAKAVEAMRGRPGARLIDARAPDRFRGENETLDPAAGHIPGAVNRFFKGNVDENGIFKPAGALREELTTTLAGVPPTEVVCYCGSGVTACHNLLAMEHAGLAGAKLYPGSWSEWSADPDRPQATGEK